MNSEEAYWADRYQIDGDPRDRFASRAEQEEKVRLEAEEYERCCKLYGRMVDAEKPFRSPVPEDSPAQKMRDKVYGSIDFLERSVDSFRDDIDLMLYARRVAKDDDYWAKRTRDSRRSKEWGGRS